MITAELMSAQDAATNQVSAPYQKGDLTTFSVHFRFSDASIGGTASLECSNDRVEPPTDWVEITDSPIAIAAGESAVLNVSNAGYRWVRAAWTAGAGAGTVTATLCVMQPANRN